MAIAGTAQLHEEEIGGQSRRLLLRNGEIERFEAQYAPFGFFDLFDQLFGRGPAPQVRHVREQGAQVHRCEGVGHAPAGKDAMVRFRVKVMPGA
jgi:hypothetical protein